MAIMNKNKENPILLALENGIEVIIGPGVDIVALIMKGDTATRQRMMVDYKIVVDTPTTKEEPSPSDTAAAVVLASGDDDDTNRQQTESMVSHSRTPKKLRLWQRFQKILRIKPRRKKNVAVPPPHQHESQQPPLPQLQQQQQPNSQNMISKKELQRYCPICLWPFEDNHDNKSMTDLSSSSSFVRLSCQHEYCDDCFNTWMTTDHAHQFPLMCLAENCSQVIPISIIQTYMKGEEWGSLLHSAVHGYILARKDQYRFCPLPTCTGIYEITKDESFALCSLCCSQVCIKCHKIHDPNDDDSNGDDNDIPLCKRYQLEKLQIETLRLQIIEEIITLRCPNCHQAFIDFEGCFALQCSNCSCNFCGWCLQDCDDNKTSSQPPPVQRDDHDDHHYPTHVHVRNCLYKPIEQHDDYYGTMRQFRHIHNRRRQEKIQTFLQDYSPDIRQHVIIAMKQDFYDLGMTIMNDMEREC